MIDRRALLGAFGLAAATPAVAVAALQPGPARIAARTGVAHLGFIRSAAMPPPPPADRIDLWLDTSDEMMIVRRWCQDAKAWISAAPPPTEIAYRD